MDTCSICQHTGVHVTCDKENTCKDIDANTAKGLWLLSDSPGALWSESDPPGLTPRLPVPGGFPFF